MKRNKEGNLEIVKAVNMKTGMSSTDPVNVTDEDKIQMDFVQENEDGSFEMVRMSKHKRLVVGKRSILPLQTNSIPVFPIDGEDYGIVACGDTLQIGLPSAGLMRKRKY